MADTVEPDETKIPEQAVTYRLMFDAGTGEAIAVKGEAAADEKSRLLKFAMIATTGEIVWLTVQEKG